MHALDPTAARAVALRDASTTLVLRDAAGGFEVLMVKRSPHASFMPGAHVFPGGAVDAAAGSESTVELAARVGRVTRVGPRARAYAAAALRECREECGLDLGSTRALQPWSHWVTPLGLPKRFDTLFFVARAPAGQVPQPDHAETTTLEWVAPRAALEAHRAGRFPMEFATVQTVRSLLPHADGPVQALLDHAAALADLPPLHPRLRLDAARQVRGIALPGEPGYEALDGD